MLWNYMMPVVCLSALLAACAPAPPSSTADEALVVDARVVTRPIVPNPTQADYADCLVAFDLETIRGSLPAGSRLSGLTWAFRNRTAAPSATITANAEIRATLRKMTAREVQEFSSLLTLDDSESWDQERFWLEGWATMNQGGVPTGAETLALRPVDTASLPPHQAAFVVDADRGVQRDGWVFRLLRRSIFRPLFWEIEGALSNGACGAKTAILDFAEQLKHAGVPLVVVLVPRSTSVFPEIATGIPYSPVTDPRANAPLGDFVKLLRSEGLDVLDLTHTFLAERVYGKENTPAYLANDSHWSPLGARAAAEATAAHIGETYGIETEVPIESAMQIWSHAGDYGYLLDDPTSLPIEETPYTVPEITDDAMLEIAVIGDSFLGIYQNIDAGYAEHLDARLPRHRLSTFASPGGVTEARRRFVRERGIEGLDLVVWQIAEDLLANHEMWRAVPLNPGAERRLALGSAEVLGSWHAEGEGTRLRFEPVQGSGTLRWKRSLGSFSTGLRIGKAGGPVTGRATVTVAIVQNGHPVFTRSFVPKKDRDLVVEEIVVPLGIGEFQLEITSGQGTLPEAIVLENPRTARIR